MPEISPQSFFRFAADHHAILVALHYRRDRIGEADLLALIRSHAHPSAPGAEYLLGQLLALGFVEPAAGATAEYEMTRHVAGLLDVLLRQYRLTSVAVIQAYVDTLQASGAELAERVGAGDDAQVVRILNDLADTIERLRQDSRSNRDAIVVAAVRAKVNAERETVAARFAEINRLWQKYIVPLRDMIDERKVLDATLDDLARTLAWSAGELRRDAILLREIQGAGARLLRMRRDVTRDFGESVREISPLYHDLQRDTRLTRGAALALEHADRRGHRALRLPHRLALPVWRLEGQLDDTELRAYLHQIRDYRPGRPRPLREAAADGARGYIEPDDLARRVAGSLPIADAWTWLLTEYPDASTAQILRAHALLRRGHFGPVRLGPARHTYRTRTHEIEAHPLEVAARS
jgi:hypothetical protein